MLPFSIESARILHGNCMLHVEVLRAASQGALHAMLLHEYSTEYWCECTLLCFRCNVRTRYLMCYDLRHDNDDEYDE